jgi:peptidoglycan/LPS O-acetylase OafA/YrhL
VHSADSTDPKSRFRPDVEGLRANAIAAVLLCHAGLPFAGGGYVGVDVFFVISGFLITRLLLGELDRTGGISLLRFYARRARRLLPLLFVVLAAVVVLSRLLLSPLRGAEVSGDVVSSAFYFANWHFAAQSVDYFAQGLEPSPVQHLWSLAIEEQFYLAWPTLMLLAVWPLAMRGRSPRPVLWAVVAIVIGVSLAVGVQLTGEQPSAAYFSTLGRAWELGLGASLALLGAVRMPGWTAATLGWAGLAAIVYAILAFDSETPFPGLAALVPTLGTAALILAGAAGRAGAASPSRALSLAPVRYVGRISYSWYLWHWPALVFAAALWGPLSVPASLAVLAASWIPTELSHRWVEEPFRSSTSVFGSPARALAMGLGCTVVAAGAGAMLASSQPDLRTAPAGEVAGAAALARQPEPQKRADAVRPNPLDARDDRSRMYDDGCLVGMSGTKSNRCVYGASKPKRTIVLFGDSHAMQYFPALERLAEKHRWRLIALAKAECPPAQVEVRSATTGGEYSECDVWRERTLKRIAATTGSAMVLISSASDYTPLAEDGRALSGRERTVALERGYEATLRRVRDSGHRAAVIKDPPAAKVDVPSCVSERLQSLDACSFPRQRSEAEEVDARAVRKTRGAHLIDVTEAICPKDVCRAVIGNALVYRDRSHLSATFARTLSPWLERGLRRAKLI